MVKKKIKSKRIRLKDKYKVIRKVKEHHRKIRKEAKNNPHFRKYLKKDAGVPYLWPMKQDLLKHLQLEKKESLETEKKLIEEKKRKRPEKVEKKKKLFEENNDAITPIVKESTNKTYFREFKKLIKISDVILEVLDARDPLGSRSLTLEKQILSLYPNKKIILVLNKIDLIPRENLMEWLGILRGEYPTIGFMSTTQIQKHNNRHRRRKASRNLRNRTSKKKCLGADTLIQLLKNYVRSLDIKKKISVGIIGFPNVGKSSLINSLKHNQDNDVGARPGVTGPLTEVSLDKNITLIDSPGIIFTTDMSESDAALRNCINLQQIANFILPVETILNLCPQDRLYQIYKISTFNSTTQFLINVATQRGIQKGGAPDIESAARLVLNDWNAGRIPYYTVPPELSQNRLEATIVSQWSEALKFSDIMELEQTTVIDELGENADLFYATAVPSQPLTPHDAFMRLDRPDDDILEDIRDPVPIPKKNKKKNKKKKERKAKLQIDNGTPEEPNKDSDYDFGKDFWENPEKNPATSTTNENTKKDIELLDRAI